MNQLPNARSTATVLAMLLVLARQPAPLSAASPNAPPDAAPLEQLVKRMVIENAPRHYEKLDGWGRTREIVSGLDVWRDGLQIKTKRRRKQVNHGTWKRYYVEMNDPHRDFDIQINQLPNPAEDTLRFDVAAAARLQVFGRAQRWNRGVRMASISMDAETVVRLTLRMRIKIVVNSSQFPPDVAFRPRIEQADLKLLKFDTRRISHLRGSLAEELGDGLRGTIREKLDEAEPKLVEKMNAKLKQRRDDFRLSLADWAKSQWARLTGDD